MYIVGEAEIEAVAAVIRSGALFRYGDDSQCERFEKRYAQHLGAGDFALSASGTYALAAGLIGFGIGPGDEVLVPAHTYMATATSVLAVGAIPVLVDVDQSITLDPAAFREAIGPRTRAVIPVHMWGAACNMDAIMEIAAKHDILVLEDACQGVGGAYEGRKMGSIGHAGAFSFNYFKNMTGGEGGGIASSDARVMERARCAIDPCHFYWQGRSDSIRPFAGIGARASELMGAMLNVQLDRLDDMIASMRRQRRAVLDGIRPLHNIGLQPAPMNSPDHDCAAQLMLTMPSAEAAKQFVAVLPSVIASKTGRHTFPQWDQVLMHEGAHHPALNPYKLPENQGCRMDYDTGAWQRSIDILDRTVMLPMHPLHTDQDIGDMVHNIGQAARVVFEGMPAAAAKLRRPAAVDQQKFDSVTTATGT
ncbi:MAG: DegT/DnrJ/EryC1/StrS family aminotransferase [Rhizobiaceae bacterium]|nr:DegT/DnrJ/EryC1/StrS family aminotransferase [Rhizobiaceae bacterium]